MTEEFSRELERVMRNEKHDGNVDILEISPEEAKIFVSEGYETLLMRPDKRIRGEFRSIYLIGKDGEYETFVDAIEYDEYRSSLTVW